MMLKRILAGLAVSAFVIGMAAAPDTPSRIVFICTFLWVGLLGLGVWIVAAPAPQAPGE